MSSAESMPENVALSSESSTYSWMLSERSLSELSMSP